MAAVNTAPRDGTVVRETATTSGVKLTALAPASVAIQPAGLATYARDVEFDRGTGTFDYTRLFTAETTGSAGGEPKARIGS